MWRSTISTYRDRAHSAVCWSSESCTHTCSLTLARNSRLFPSVRQLSADRERDDLRTGRKLRGARELDTRKITAVGDEFDAEFESHAGLTLDQCLRSRARRGAWPLGAA